MIVADRVEVRGLRVMGVCGVLPEEQARPQPLELDLDAVVDLAAAGQSDALEDTLDYGALCEVAERVVTEGRHALVERIAERVAEIVLADDRVQEVSVAVRKLRPPVPQDLATAGVRITRRRGPDRDTDADPP